MSDQPAAAPPTVTPDAAPPIAPDVAPNDATSAYRVLARKYRPASFDDLVGQDAMVQTLTNAFRIGRIAHAFMLTGVRGVGKTTTARLLARALNYRKDGTDQPCMDITTPGDHCAAIMESRHVDVMEMDAASRTGVSDIRELIDGVPYLPVMARFKVYIIDEVHMLSTSAFNALLKTLEEPPAHVKFIFATTENRKVPVTVLSRCQRFDLRRLEAADLSGLLSRVCEKESVTISDAALRLIAHAADGSARDGLSLLDQAIAHGDGAIEEEPVRDMLGLADRARILSLFEALMRGDAAAALGDLRDHYRAGADPAVVMSDLADLTHWLTCLKVAGKAHDESMAVQAERQHAADMANRLSLRVLSRSWQMLLKGVGEVRMAHKPLAAAEMVLVRLAHAADLPTPDDIIRQVDAAPSSAPAPAAPAAPATPAAAPAAAAPATPAAAPAAAPTPAAAPAPTPAPAPAPAKERRLESFDEVLALLDEKRDIRLATALQTRVHLVDFAEGHITFRLASGHDDPSAELTRTLRRWTGRPWRVTLSEEEGAPTLRDQQNRQRQALRERVAADPLVGAALAAFPDASIVSIEAVSGDAAVADDSGAPPPSDAPTASAVHP